MENTSDLENITESICEKLNNNTLNDFDKANLMRLDLVTSYHDLMSRSEDAAANYIVEEHLKNYIPLICNSSINNYAEGLKTLFSSSTKISTNWEPIQIDDINDLLPSDLNCKGEYENCKYNEVNDEDVKNFDYFKTHMNENTKIDGTGTQLKSNDENLSDFFREDLAIPSTSIDTSQRYQNYQEHSARNERFSFSSEFPKKTSRDNFHLNVQNIAKENQTRNCFPLKEENFNNDNNEQTKKQEFFRTATEELFIQNMKKNLGNSSSQQPQKALLNYGMSKKSLGIRRSVRSNFIPPVKRTFEEMEGSESSSKDEINTEQPTDERLKNIDEKMIEMIKNEIMHKVTPINWDDIAGLEYAKSIIQEAVVWPLLRPDIFTGLRRPPRGILLFGPPGTGKTLIGKCIASQSKSTFFSISASSLTSKWVGEGEKMVRALFAVAAIHQPSVVFIDEIDSLLCQRSESEHESSRRIKTEFLVQLDGAATSEEERILIVGATNRPQELDEAARRRLVRRLYIPLPEIQARNKMLKNLLSSVSNELSDDEINKISALTDGYSGADMKTLCTEASMEPIRSIPSSEIPYFDKNNVRPVIFRDFETALKRVRASVSQDDLKQYIEWNNIYGSGNVS